MEYISNYNLKKHTSFSLAPESVHAVYIDTPHDLLLAEKKALELHLKPYPLGGGTNTIFTPHAAETYLFLISRIYGIEYSDNDDFRVVCRVGSGELWDDVVRESVEKGFSGIEALSWIPGTAGAAPFQNIGAYGKELRDVLHTVTAYDFKTHTEVIFSNKECEFSYRDSIFKREKGRYMITHIELNLKKDPFPPVPQYKDVLLYCGHISKPSLKEIREAIIDIRQKKLPDPTQTPNAGSYFKNPTVSKDHAERLKTLYPSLPLFPTENENVKVSAGWLIEHAGFKGFVKNNFAVHEKHALVIIHTKKGTVDELLAFEKEIREAVESTYGITLEREPVIE